MNLKIHTTQPALKRCSLSLLFVLILGIFGCNQSKEREYFHRGGRQGSIIKYFLLEKRIVKRFKHVEDVIYSATIETDDKDLGVSKERVLVQCSTKEPFVASLFKDDNVTKIDVRYLNPGGHIYGYMESTHGIYWIVCHDTNLLKDYSILEEKGKNLGYSLNLDERRIVINSANLDQLLE